MRTARTAAALHSDINVTPLVDVCLVLLIIFMIVLPQMLEGIPVQLPQTRHSDPADPSRRQLAITVKDDGSVYLDTLVVRREQIAGEMQRLHEQWPQRPIAVRGDARVPYGAVVEVLDACRKAGYEDVALASAKRE